jgi:hypothetical protein
MSNLTTPERNDLPTHIIRKPLDGLSKEARKGIGKRGYSKRIKDVSEALPRQIDWRNSTYRTGDGDHTTQVPRPGSLVAFSLPSKGHKT